MHKLITILFLLSSTAVASRTKIRLSVKEAINLALKQNFSLRKLKLDDQIADLSLKRVKYATYTPTISFSSDYVAGKALTSKTASDGLTTRTYSELDSQTTETGTISVQVEPFAVFNSYKDMDNLELAKIDNYVGKIDRRENKRSTIFSIILTYYQLVFQKKTIESYQNLYSQFKSLYELKSQIRGIARNQQELFFIRNEMLRAKTSLNGAEKDYKINLQTFNALLSEPLDNDYIFTTAFEYRPIAFAKDLLKKKVNVSPSVISAQANLESSKISLKSSWKEIMPLPRLEISGFQLGHALNNENFSGQIRSFTNTSADLSTNDFGFSAILSMSIPIWSGSGFFNRISIRQSELSVATSKSDLLNARVETLKTLNSQYIEIKSSETSITDYRDAYDNSVKLVDQVYNAFLNKKTDLDALKDSLNELANTSRDLYQAYISHLSAKMSLASALGVNNLFGDRFFSLDNGEVKETKVKKKRDSDVQ